MLNFTAEVELFHQRAPINVFVRENVYHYSKDCVSETNLREEQVSYFDLQSNLCRVCEKKSTPPAGHKEILEISTRLENLLTYYNNVELNDVTTAASLLEVVNSKNKAWVTSHTRNTNRHDMIAYLIVVKQIDVLLYDKVNAYFENGYTKSLFKVLDEIYENDVSSKVKIPEGDYLLFSQEITGSNLFSSQGNESNLNVVFDYYYGASKNNLKALPYEVARFVPEEFQNALKLVPENCNKKEFIETFEILFRDTAEKSLKTFEEIFEITTNLMEI